MKKSIWQPWSRWLVAIGLLSVAGVLRSFWLPTVSAWVATVTATSRAATGGDSTAPEHAHAGTPHGTGQPAFDSDEHLHDDVVSLELSTAARQNLGLTSAFLTPIELSTYERTITIPAVLTTRPGRTQVHVSTPLTGVITHVHAVPGEAVIPGTLLFEIRLTHEELVSTQTEFLKTLGERDVEKLELARLESVAASGAISEKSVLERRYARDRLEASLSAQREALKLHGLSDRQIDGIEQDRRLLRSLEIVAPDVDEHDHEEELRLSSRSISTVSRQEHSRPAQAVRHPLIVDHLSVHKGQSVTAGDNLCMVSDYALLFIEGHAFEQDAAAISLANENRWSVSAVFPEPEGDKTVEGLSLAFVGSEVDLDSRTLSVYVELPNVVTRDTHNNQGQRFISWKYRPGQRLQLRVPVEQWRDEIVLPVEAVVRDGVDWYAFRQNGRYFERVAVHVRHRDPSSVVIAHDGAVFPGEVVARRSAHQMLMAIRKNSGAELDPHAGHSH